jgi:hypothetical protein
MLTKKAINLGPASRKFYAGYMVLPGHLHIWARVFGRVIECDFKAVK